MDPVRLNRCRKRILETSEQPIPRKIQRRGLHPETCLFCQKKEKYVKKKGVWSKEFLANVETIDKARESIYNVALALDDSDVLPHVCGQDLVAYEIKYHRSCYRNYIRKDKENQKTEDSPHVRAFHRLTVDINEKILKKNQVYTIVELNDLYKELLLEEDIGDSDFRTDKLKSKLLQHYGSRLSCHQTAKKGSTIVYNSAIDVGVVLETLVSASKKTESNDLDMTCPNSTPFRPVQINSVAPEILPPDITPLQTSKQTIYYVAKELRNKCKEVTSHIPWPPQAQSIREDAIDMDEAIYLFLAWLLTGRDYGSLQDVQSELKETEKRHVLSVAQDCIHIINKGRVKTPKHVGLPFAIKSICGGSRIISMLNKFGHCLSYDQLEEMEAAIAETVQQSQTENGVTIPSVCVPGVFHSSIWDNNDLQEDTRSGHGTTHCTNGVIVQRKPDSCITNPFTTPVRQISHKRSIECMETEFSVDFVCKKQAQPPKFDINSSTLFESDISVTLPAELADFGWFLSRLPVKSSIFDLDLTSSQVVPAWTAFNIEGTDVPRKSIVGYCPVINASPTEMPTVCEIMKRSILIAEQLEQENPVMVFDQAIYCKALSIKWQNPDTLNHCVIRMGAFHIAMTFIAVIGKRFAGLYDILVESGVMALGSVNSILDGKHYNRAMRSHKLVLEALQRLRWAAFERKMENSTHYNELLKNIAAVRTSFNRKNIKTLLGSTQLAELYHEYKDFCEHDDGPMKQFWGSYIDMTLLLLQFVRSTREGCWDLHLHSIGEIIQWIKSYDRTNYARYLPVYWIEMLLLPQTHPEVHKYLAEGEFVCQLNDDHGFSQVPQDQTIEMTLNKGTKTKGGIIGLSCRPAAVDKHILSSHERTAITDGIFEMAGITSTSPTPKEKLPTRIKADEEDVKRVKDTIINWGNPFLPSQELSSLASGVVVDQDRASTILSAKCLGRQQMRDFIDDRLVKGSVPYNKPLTKNNLHFGDLKPKMKYLQASVSSDRNLYARLLVIAQKRTMDLKQVLSYELGSIPPSLARADGNLANTTKCKLTSLIETPECVLKTIPDKPECTAIIIDAMALLQSIPATAIPSTYGDLSALILNKVLAGGARRTDFVIDVYKEKSIKASERAKRSSGGSVNIQISSPLQKCTKQWTKALRSNETKTSLLKFLADSWSTNTYAEVLQDRILVVTTASTCLEICSDGKDVCVMTLKQLESNHEEADTRLLLHAQHAALAQYDPVIIKASDTDVEVLAVHFQEYIPAQLILSTATRIVDVKKLAQDLGPTIASALLGFHAFTGCDTVSSFVNKGKTAAFGMLNRHKYQSAFQDIGETFTVSSETCSLFEEFVCDLYKTKEVEVGSARYMLFTKTEKIEPHLLPPSRDALQLHISRANYQASIWRRALDPKPTIPAPFSHGWQEVNGKVEVKWLSGPPAPLALLELVTCGCKTECGTRRCTCLKNGLPCTDACRCPDTCLNAMT